MQIETRANMGSNMDKNGHIPLIVFGMGPIIDPLTRQKAEETKIVPGSEEMIFWGKDLAQAAAILYQQGESGLFIPSGGRTGGLQYKSEAELLSETMQDLGIPGEKIIAENNAIDTPTNYLEVLNLPNFVNEAVDQPFDLLAVPAMFPRVLVFAKLFAVNIRNSFISTEVLRYSARQSEPWDQSELQRLETIEDMNDSRFFLNQKGEEQRDFYDRTLKDSLWIRQALEFPERLLALISKVGNEDRMRKMLDIAFNIHSAEEMAGFDIDLGADVVKLRQTLAGIPWNGQPNGSVDQWVKEELTVGWPAVTRYKYDKLMDP